MWLLNLIEQFSKINSVADVYLKTLLDRSHELKLSNKNKCNCNIKMEQMLLPRFYGEPCYFKGSGDYNLNDNEIEWEIWGPK